MLLIDGETIDRPWLTMSLLAFWLIKNIKGKILSFV
jgi:hypothetical protein